MKAYQAIIPLAVFIFLWQTIVWLGNYPEFLLPSPWAVTVKFWQAGKSGLLIENSLITLSEILAGLVLGVGLAFVLGYLAAKLPFLNSWFLPVFIGLQAIPIIALAPLLVIWFGWGWESKVIVCGATLFFPVFVNTLLAFNSVNRNLRQLFDSLQASAWQKFKYLEVPSSLPIIFAGLKIGVGLSIIGAVVGEFVASNKGLGFLINLAGGFYDTPLRFAAFFTLSLIAIILYNLVSILEKRTLKWL